jgi:hypothetical protein
MYPTRIGKFIFASAIATISLIGALSLDTSPAGATGWNVDQGASPAGNQGYIALTYSSSLKGAEWGYGTCLVYTADSGASLGDNNFDCAGWGSGNTTGLNQVVRNNAHSIASFACYGATTWVYANFVGDFNWVDAFYYGTLNSALANNENSAFVGTEC